MGGGNVAGHVAGKGLVDRSRRKDRRRQGGRGIVCLL